MSRSSQPKRPDKTPIPMGTGPTLLVDHHFIEVSEGIRLKLHPPRKTGEKLLVTDKPWEDATLNWFTVVKDGRRYRMWVEAYDRAGWPTTDDTSFCTAESSDGIHWRKPSLGLHEHQGRRDTNILFRQIGTGPQRSRVHGSCVFIDPSAPPESRYQCVSQGLFHDRGNPPYRVAGMVSPDGLRWTRLQDPIGDLFADSQYSGFVDPKTGEHWMFGRVAGARGRAIGMARSRGFGRFPTLSKVLETSQLDPPDSDLYNPACIPCPGADGIYFMFPSLFRHREDTLDIRLAVSRDGQNWTWPERGTPFLGLGAPGEFDSGSLYMGNGACLPTGDHWSFYYSGSPLKHGEVDLPQLSNPHNQRVISRAIGHPHRLVSASPATTEGRFTTPLLSPSGRFLKIDCATLGTGSVRVGVSDFENNPVPGYTIDDCQPVVAGKPSTANVRWKRSRAANPFDRPVRLTFVLNQADVFGLRFTNHG